MYLLVYWETSRQDLKSSDTKSLRWEGKKYFYLCKRTGQKILERQEVLKIYLIVTEVILKEVIYRVTH